MAEIAEINVGKAEPWLYLAITVLAVIAIASIMVTDYQTREVETEVPSQILAMGQEYTISEMLEKQTAGMVYLLSDNSVMWNVRLSQTRSGNILTGVTYYPQLVLVASYGSDGEMLQEQVMRREKYPNVPAENPAETPYPMFGRYEELEINAWAMELTLPQGTETIKMYTNG